MQQTGPSRISIALCTYNGEKFLPQQLSSIQQQVRLPDEVVVCDDKSYDRTVQLVRDFAKRVSFPVTITENKTTLGSAKNFEQAIRLCSGDLIALSDQDDIWYPNRLERLEREFSSHPEAALAFSDADLIDEQDHLLHETLWQRLGFKGVRRERLLAGQSLVLAKHRFVTGATAMFRSRFRDRFLPIPDGWIHDEWITMIVAAFGSLLAIDQPLIRYRVHASQQVGFRNKLKERAHGTTASEKHWARIADSAKELKQICEALAAMQPLSRPEVFAVYQRHLQFLQFRAGLPVSRVPRLGALLKHSNLYLLHASGLRSMGKDLLLRRR